MGTYRQPQPGGHRVRHQALIGVDFMRVGSFRINPANPFGNNTVMHDMADNSVGGGRNLLYNDIRQLDTSGNTPTRRAAYRLGTEFRRTDPGAPIQLACQVNAGMLFTDGYINESAAPPPLGNLDGALGAPFADGYANTMADIATWSYVNNLRPDLQPGRVAVPSGCSSATPDPRLDCQRNPHMNYYGITLVARGEFYASHGVTNYPRPLQRGPQRNREPAAVMSVNRHEPSCARKFSTPVPRVRDAMREY